MALESKVYRQIHSTVMGSPVSVVVANLVMEDMEQEALYTNLPYTTTVLEEIR